MKINTPEEFCIIVIQVKTLPFSLPFFINSHKACQNKLCKGIS